MSPSKFDHDLFVSYAHVDNETLAEGQTGWVELLETRLRIRLRQLLGEDVNLWRDPTLQGNDTFSDVLLARLGKAASLVSVLSPRYLNSEWCQKELQAFCKSAELNGGLTIGSKSRVFKVVKTYIPRDKHPPLLKGLLGYEFYQYDESTRKAREFNPDIDPKKDQRYWDKLEDLALDIKQLLETLDGSPDESFKGTVYLAETTSDLSTERDNIRRELRQHDYQVLPDRELPLNAQALEQAIREYLQQSRLSIHLIGAHYGVVPELEERSMVRIQYELAAEYRNEREFPRLIWMPPGLQANEERQQAFLDELQRSHAGPDLLQTKPEDLKTVIHARLAPKPKSNGNGRADHGPARVYLICDKQDYEEVQSLEDYLYEQNLEVIPHVEGDAKYHNDNLLLCDALLIYYNRAADPWAQIKRQELIKLPGLGRAKPILAKAFYISGDMTPQKERFRSHEALVIKHFGDFMPELLAPFLTQIQQAKGMSS